MIIRKNVYFGEVKRGIDGNYYVPNMGRPMDKIHSYSGSNGSFSNVSVLPTETVNTLSSGLPTQVFKIFTNPAFALDNYVRTVGDKDYELTDHLGNVRVVISDTKLFQDVNTNATVDNGDKVYADVKNFSDYYAGGMLMPGRQYNSGSSYRYGFNGKENDDEVKGEGNQQDYGMRIYDGRIGKFLSVDPLTKQYPQLTPFQFASNTPILAIDLDGLEGALPNQNSGNTNIIVPKSGDIDISDKTGTMDEYNKKHGTPDLKNIVETEYGPSRNNENSSTLWKFNQRFAPRLGRETAPAGEAAPTDAAENGVEILGQTNGRKEFRPILLEGILEGTLQLNPDANGQRGTFEVGILNSDGSETPIYSGSTDTQTYQVPYTLQDGQSMYFKSTGGGQFGSSHKLLIPDADSEGASDTNEDE